MERGVAGLKGRESPLGGALHIPIYPIQNYTSLYYAICFFTLLTRGTINAVTAVCGRQAVRWAGLDQTGRLLICRSNVFFIKMSPSVRGVPKLGFLAHMAMIKENKSASEIAWSLR